MGGVTSGTRYGNGAGWGGPAKGAGKPARAFDADDAAAVRPAAGPGRGHISETTAAKQAVAAERAEQMRAVLAEIAVAGRSEMARVQAAQALLNRIEGMPVQANLNVNTDDVSRLSDDELRAELARLGGDAAAAATGDAAAGDSPELPGLRR